MKEIPRLHRFVFSVIPIFGCLASMVMGYFIVYLTMLEDEIAHYNGFTPDQSQLYFTVITASLPLAAFFTACFYKCFVDRFGEKVAMQIMDYLAIISVCLHLLNLNVGIVCVSRVLMGMYCGITTGLVPSWIISMSPSYTSGIFGTFNQLAIALGMAEAYFMGQFLEDADPGDQSRVRIFIGLPIVFSLVHLFGLRLFGFDNIERLIQKRHNTEVITYMKTVYGPNWKKFENEIRNFKMLPEELQPIKEANQSKEGKESKESESGKNHTSMEQTLAKLKQKLKCKLICEEGRNCKMALMLAFANHASGLVAILEYSRQLFERIQGSIATADTVLVGLGFFQVLVTFVSGFLINRYGRRPMMLIGQAIIVLSLLFCGVVSLAIEKHEAIITFAIFFYTMGYSISLGPLFMMYAIESFADLTVVIAAYWGVMVIFTFTTDFLIEEMDISLMFFIFFACSALSLAYFCRRMVETKGASKKQVKQLMEREAGNWEKSALIFSQSTSVTKDAICTSSAFVPGPETI